MNWIIPYRSDASKYILSCKKVKKKKRIDEQSTKRFVYKYAFMWAAKCINV